METITKKKQKQTLACALADCFTVAGDLTAATRTLIDSIERRELVPERNLLRLGHACAKKGDLSNLEVIYQKLNRKIPREKLALCARSAMGNGYLYTAQRAYQEAGMNVPTKKLLKQADKLFAQKKLPIERYQDLYEMRPTATFIKAVEKHLRYSMKVLSAEQYVLCCEAINQDVDKDFLKKCLDHYLAEMDYQKTMYVANKIGTPSKKVLLSTGKKAFRSGKPKDGERFLQLAFAI